MRRPGANAAGGGLPRPPAARSPLGLLQVAAVVALLTLLPFAGGASGPWELEEVWDDELIEYVTEKTPPTERSEDDARLAQGNVPCGEEDFGVVEGCERVPLRWEQEGWYEVLKWKTSAGMFAGKDYIDTGLGYNLEDPQTLDEVKAKINNAQRHCGPSTDRSPDREQGCSNENPDGSPGPGPQQWAYRGRSMGPPDELPGAAVGGVPCDYTLPLGSPGYEACFAHPTGMLPHMQSHYSTVPLRWGFEEGSFYPFWTLLSSGMPNFVIRKHCFLDSFSGEFQLCSAYPWDQRELHHGLLRVRSVPFTLGSGDLTFESNGGDVTVPDFPEGAYPIEVRGEGTLGVALTRVSDEFRVLQVPVRSRRFWSTERWTSAVLAPFVGEKFVIEIFDFRCCNWGWLALDAFVIPSMHVEIETVYPSGGPRAGGGIVEISGRGFGESSDGVTVFIGESECKGVTMLANGRLNCVVPPGEGIGLTVTVVVGDYDRNLQQGPFGGHQAGHCGDASEEWPYSKCASSDDVDYRWGVPARGYTYRDEPAFISEPVLAAQEDATYVYTVAADDPDGDDLVYSAVTLPSWAVFDSATRAVSGTPLRSDVQCRNDDWHPARDRCMGGGNHTVVLTVSDYFYVITQEFVINVAFRPTPLLSIDASFHWPTLPEHQQVRRVAQSAKYHLWIPAALAGRRIQEPSDDAAGVARLEQLPGRSPVENSLRTMARSLLRENWIHPGELHMMARALAATGQAAALRDVMSRARAALRRQQEVEARNRIAYLAVQGREYEGWYHQLRDLLFNDASGTVLLALDPAEARILLTVPCNDAPELSRLHVSCGFDGYVREHELRIRIGEEGLRIDDITVRQAGCIQGTYPATACSSGIPYSDLLNRVQRDNDYVALLRGLQMRLSAYQYRWEQFSMLPGEYEPMWQPTSSLLRVRLGGNITALFDIDHSYPWPTPPSATRAAIRVVSVEGAFPFYARESAEAVSEELTEEARGNLTDILELAEERLLAHSKRCINDCNGNGRCDVSLLPPRCECFEGYTHDDCSHVLCSNDCSGRGACDSRLVCRHVDDTGEDICEGGTAKCACDYPYFGPSCELSPCPQNFVTLSGVNVSGGVDAAAAALTGTFAAQYGPVLGARVLVDPDFTSGNALLVEAADQDVSGLAHIEFAHSRDAEVARDDLLRGSIPSRGVGVHAQQFVEALREQQRGEKRALALFGLPSGQCGSRGACNYRAGECYCAGAYYGAACEYNYCANDCGGHGECDELTGRCRCEAHFLEDKVLGCAREPLHLASTTCEDEALDPATDDKGMRVSPLYLSCYLGVPLGGSVTGGYNPSGEAEGWYTTVDRGELCADCSGYGGANITDIDIYPEQRLLKEMAENNGYLRPQEEWADVISPPRGIGALPDTSVTINLQALRDRALGFSYFQAEPGIVREWSQCLSAYLLPGQPTNLGWQVGEATCDQQGADGLPLTHGCLCKNSMCGAMFEVRLDGREEPVWKSVVASADFVSIDVRNATTITLTTSRYRGSYWRYSGMSYTSAQVPSEGSWCDGSAWASAMLL